MQRSYSGRLGTPEGEGKADGILKFEAGSQVIHVNLALHMDAGFLVF